MNEEERIIEAVPIDYEEAMQTATFDEAPIPVVEEPLSPDLVELLDLISREVEEAPTTEEVNEHEESTLIDDTLQVTEEPSVGLTPEEQAILDQAIATQDSEIPVNSATLQLQESTSRFSGAIWYEAIQQKSIILAGLGGIGSYVAFLLARMQPARITMYDDDRVEAANMSGQLYSTTDVGNYKGNAIYQMMKNYGYFFNGNVINQRFTDQSSGGPIMICGFDNMEARKVFFDAWKDRLMPKPEEERGKMLFIDGRLAAEEFQVIAIQGDDERAMKLYEEEWLFSDAEAEETLCSYKQTTFMANMIGSVMVNLFVNFVANECDPVFPRDVPFLTTYDATTMYYKVEM